MVVTSAMKYERKIRPNALIRAGMSKWAQLSLHESEYFYIL